MPVLLRRLLTGSLLLLVASASVPAVAFDRLDPEERIRLRRELRRHALEDRVRAREAWRGGPPHRFDAPPPAAAPGYGVPPVDSPMGYRGPGYPGGAPGGQGGPVLGPALSPPVHGQADGPGHAGGPRLSPEERQALRRQLREARRHGLGDPSGSR